ncbi:hypothetical protein BDZ91DRAFT_796641 [Kalaharituber pfeilii]|nr:hypothetical protein BDZ91DRAFT_796641 [Kalaharituber pfeilii]
MSSSTSPSLDESTQPQPRRAHFLLLPAEILEQIALETHAADAISLWLTHPKLHHLFRPQNNLFWFKTTLRNYALHYGPTLDKNGASPSGSSQSDNSFQDHLNSPTLQALWQMNILRGLPEMRATKSKEHLIKYDPNFDYFARIKFAIQGKRACQICCVGLLSESKFYNAFNRRLCHPCFEDMTINRPKIRFLNLDEDKSYRFVKYRRKNGSIQFACWLPDILRILPDGSGITGIHDIERLYNAKYNAARSAITTYRDQTREAVIRAAIEIYKTDPVFTNFRSVFTVEQMEEYAWGLEKIPSVEEIVRVCKKPKTKVWCIEVAKKEVLPQTEIVPDSSSYREPGITPAIKYTRDKAGNLKPISGAGKTVIIRNGVPPAIKSAVFRYHEERFIQHGAGWDHNRPGENLLIGTCKICMEKSLKDLETQRQQQHQGEKRKRDEVEPRDYSPEGLAEDYSARLTGPGTILDSPSFAPGPSTTVGHEAPLAKRTKTSHMQDVTLTEYVPQPFIPGAAGTLSLPRRQDPLHSVQYTGAELAKHYEGYHVEKFYSGEEEGEGGRLERGKGGYWFWNLGEEEESGNNDDTTHGVQNTGQSDQDVMSEENEAAAP